MDICVIIPTYNRKDLLNYTLQSLSPEFHPGVDLEIIVVDDHSTDGTLDFVASHFPAVKTILNSKKGSSSARNTGLKMALSNYVLYLDSDDLIGEGFFLEKYKYLTTHTETNACYGNYDFFRSDNDFKKEDIIFKYKYPIICSVDKKNEHLVNFLAGNFIPPNAIVWRKDFLLKLNGHNESLIINQDVDLVIRAVFQDLKIVGINDGTEVFIREHSLDLRVGNAGNSELKWMQILDLRKQYLIDLKNSGYKDAIYYKTMSEYAFNIWKKIRHIFPGIAKEYLDFCRENYWPVTVKGNFIYQFIGKIMGPVKTTELKYFLLKRD